MKTTIAFAAATLTLATAMPAAAQTQLITNGGFETGTFAGWTVNTQAGSNGTISIDAPGTDTPVAGFSTAANAAGGSFYAVTDQTGPGAYALAQTFAVATGTTALNLSFQLFANNYGGGVFGGGSLDFNDSPNQNARVDLLVAGADPFSVAATDVLATFYFGADGFGVNPYTSYSVDLLPFVTGGSSYTIRFAEVDNQGFFNLGVDNVSLLSTAGVPEPSTWALMILGFGAVGGALRRRAKVAVAFG